MRTFIKSIKKILFLLVFLIVAGKPVMSDDTCIFMVSADDVEPNIVLLLDNGAEMEHIIWHESYDNSKVLTIDVHKDKLDNDGDDVTDEPDTTEELQWLDKTTTNGFTNEQGYSLVLSGVNWYIVRINNNLTLDSIKNGIQADSSTKTHATFKINGKTITLPAVPSTAKVDEVIDKAARFRYSKNYLNWLFYGTYTGNGSDLPDQSRFYFAKKAIFKVAEETQRKAYFGINAFTSSAAGSKNVQPLGFVYDENGKVDPNFKNTVNTLGTFDYSPLAEGLASIGGYYASKSSETISDVVTEYCQKNFVIVISSGVSSKDDDDEGVQFVPNPIFENHDGDSEEGKVQVDAVTYTVPTNINGSSYLDDVAHYLYTHDIADYQPGFQNVMTYTIGFMGNTESNAYLINTSNNGNGNLNLYNTSDKEYGKYHFEAKNPDTLSEQLINAINAILSKTSSFTAPVVPVTRTTSGDSIYLAFFKPGESNFWEGNVTKFGLSSDAKILNADGTAATWPNGAIKEDAKPYWATKNWADTTKPNGIDNSKRKIYTYLGSRNLTDSSNLFSVNNLTPVLLETYDDSNGPLELVNITGAFKDGEKITGTDSGATATSGTITVPESIPYTGITGSFRKGETVTGGTSEAVGTIANAGTSELINYIIGADVYDEDEDNNTSENRKLICGDPLHSEPMVVNYGDIDSDGVDEIMVFFGTNAGMMNAVNDEDGSEAWAFVPPDLLPELKKIIEGAEHQYYVDSSPVVFIKDDNKNGIIEPATDIVYLVCGERKGGTSYFALDVTVPAEPVFLWRIAQTAGTPEATTVIPELGETWPNPEFGVVKTSDIDSDPGTDVVFLGGGYSEDNSSGKCILAINAKTGEVVKEFTDIDMKYSIPSKIYALDRDYNGFTDKLYVGDMGGQIWRIGDFGPPYPNIDENSPSFPNAGENIENWTIHKLFTARCNEADCANGVDDNSNSLIDAADTSKFFYPPTVTLEINYDLVFIGSGNRDDPCNTDTDDALYAIKDKHNDESLVLSDLVNAADATANLSVDDGWYLRMEHGEKALAESVVFNKTLYATSFLPNNEACVPGGYAKLYALNYLTGKAVFDFDDDGNNDTNKVIGGGIPSKPVIVITDSGVSKLLISTSSTNPDADSGNTDAGVTTTKIVLPGINFFLEWWKELFN